MGNLDAADAQLLNLAPPTYVLGQMPSLHNHVQRHLAAEDPRRQEFERIARAFGVADPDHDQQAHTVLDNVRATDKDKKA